MVACAADEIVQAVALAPEDDDGVGREIVLVVTGGAALVETDAPDVVFFQLLKSADEVDDAGDADVFGGSGGGFDSDGAEGCGAALGDEDAVDSGGIGGAEERAEVLRVFDAVEREDQAGSGTGEEVFEVEEFAGADDGDDALMGRGMGEAGELFAGLEAETDVVLAAGVDDALEPLVVTLAGDADVVEFAAAGAQSLLDGMQAVQNLHASSINCRGKRSRLLPEAQVFAGVLRLRGVKTGADNSRVS